MEGQMRVVLTLVLISSAAMAFGVPDVPETEIPDVEIPGMELLDEVQVKLDGILDETTSLREVVPDLTVLDRLSVKLEELRDTDTELESLQAEVDALRNELVDARAEIQAVSDNLESEIGAVKTTVDEFTAGLPI
jgi:chromosome segregation ATPase